MFKWQMFIVISLVNILFDESVLGFFLYYNSSYIESKAFKNNLRTKLWKRSYLEI